MKPENDIWQGISIVFALAFVLASVLQYFYPEQENIVIAVYGAIFAAYTVGGLIFAIYTFLAKDLWRKK